MTLITDKNSANDVVSLSVFVKGGQLIDSIPGMMDVIAVSIMKGTTSKSALDISQDLDNSGIIISPSSNPDYFEIQLKSTRKDFDKAFSILADIIKNPVFKNEYIEKAKTDINQGIEESRDNPLSYAFEKFIREIYPNHPYGNVGEVIQNNLANINRDNLIAFYKQTFIPANMVVAVSGNVDPELLADKFYSAFPQKEGKVINLNNLLTNFKPLQYNELAPVAKRYKGGMDGFRLAC